MAERSKSVLAAQAYERIQKLRAERDYEINLAPESIEQKYAARINKVCEALDEDVRVFLDRLDLDMLEPDNTEAPKGERGRKA